MGCVQPLSMMASAVVLVPPFIFYPTTPLTTGLSSSLALFYLSALNSPSPNSFFCSSCKLLSSLLRSLYIGFLIPTLAALLLYAGLFVESSSDDSSSLAFATTSVLSADDFPSFLFFLFLFFFFSFTLSALFGNGLILSGLCMQNYFL